MPASLRDSLTTRLRTVNQVLRVRIDRALEPSGLALPQVGVLVAIEHAPGLSNAELARISFMTPQAMNETVAALERRRLIARTPDPVNPRILRAHLTDAGRRELREASRELRRVEAAIAAVLAPDEQRAFAGFLDRVLGALRELEEP